VTTWGDREAREAARIAAEAVREDRPAGDLTSETLIPDGARIRASILSRADGIAAGLPAGPIVLEAFGAGAAFEALAQDGDRIRAGQGIARLSGRARAILAAERTILDLLGHLSGIATKTRLFVDAAGPVRVLDTRKTIPGLRVLEKYAVRMGGGTNHRMDLSEHALIKDNHIRILRALRPKDGPAAWVAALRRARPAVIEIEAQSRQEFLECLDAGADIIMLDNLSDEDRAWAVETARAHGARAALEVSGGLGIEAIRALATSGVDRASAGALTHSAPWLDLSLEVEEVEGVEVR